jgi:hypothetical protein
MQPPPQTLSPSSLKRPSSPPAPTPDLCNFWALLKRSPRIRRHPVCVLGKEALGFELVDVGAPNARVAMHDHGYGPEKEAFGVDHFSSDGIFEEETFSSDTHCNCWWPEAQDFCDDGKYVLALVDEVRIFLELWAGADADAEYGVEFGAEFGKGVGMLLENVVAGTG